MNHLSTHISTLLVAVLLSGGLFFGCQSSGSQSETTAASASESKETKPLNRFDDAIAAFEAADQAEPPVAGSILFTGSSSIRKWESLSEDMAPLSVLNRGFGGSTMPELLHYADRIIFPYQPSCIVLYEGDNDISSEETSPADVLATVQTYYDLMQSRLPETKTFFLAVKPSIARRNILAKCQQTNALVRAFAEEHEQFYFVDVAEVMMNADGSIRSDIFISDSLHMNELGYELWTEVVRPVMMEACQ